MYIHIYNINLREWLAPVFIIGEKRHGSWFQRCIALYYILYIYLLLMVMMISQVIIFWKRGITKKEFFDRDGR